MERSSHPLQSPFIVQHQRELLSENVGAIEIKKRRRKLWHSEVIHWGSRQKRKYRKDGEVGKVLVYCSPSHYEVKNRRNLTRQNNETTWEREREWKEAVKQKIMKTSLISAETSPHLSCHCLNQYKFHLWDVLKNGRLWKLSHLLPHWHVECRIASERRPSPGNQSKTLSGSSQTVQVLCLC